MPPEMEGRNPSGDVNGINAQLVFPCLFGCFFPPSISSFLPGCLIKTPCSPTSKVLLMQPMQLLGKVSCRCALPLRAGMSDVALFHHLLENKFISRQKCSSEFCLPRAFQKASKRIKPQGCLSKYQRNNHWQFPDSLQRASREVLY